MNSFLGYRWRLFVAPGVVIHELSHALACFVTGAKIIKISFFDKDGGSVTHQKPFVPFVGQIIISIAPLVIGVLLFYLLAKMLKLNDSLDVLSVFMNVKSVLKIIDFSKWQNILITYFLFSVIVTMTPSRQDFKNMIIPSVLLLAITYLVLRFSSLSLTNFEMYFVKLSPILFMVTFLLICLLSLACIFYLFSKLVLRK